jgi:hypothetical protein
LNVRLRLLALMAMLAMFAGACATVPSSAAAVVGDTTISMAEFTRLVDARADGLGMEGRELRLVEQAADLGLYDDPTVRNVVSDAINQEQISQDNLLALPPEVLDRVVEVTRDQYAGDYEEAVAQLGVSITQWESVLRTAAQRLVAAILFYGQQQPAVIPLDRATYLRQVQTSTLSELVSVAVTRQAFESLGLELDPDDVDVQRDIIIAGFPTMEDFDQTRIRVGYPEMDDFDEFIVRHQLREQELLRHDQEEAAAARAAVEVTVQSRFGTWNPAISRVDAPVEG